MKLMTTDKTLTSEERALYHQIHPAKLATDILSTPPSLYLFWRHRPISALIVTFLPAIIASWAVMRYADLEPYKDSAVGKYVRDNMTHAMEGVRFGGLVVMVIGAWFHKPWLFPLGLGIVLFGWFRGLIFRSKLA
jgi:hypothetical protein